MIVVGIVHFIFKMINIHNKIFYSQSYTGKVKSHSGVSWACRTVTMTDMAKTLVSEERVYFQVFIRNC